MTEEVKLIKLETHPTKSIIDQQVNGSLTVIWRDWDKLIKNKPKMVYITTVHPGEIKGPHLHLKRNSYFVCIKGKVAYVIKDKNGKYLEFESSEDKPKLLFVPKKFPSAHINLSDQNSQILVLADLAWRPDDKEMINVTFDDYNWNKWSKND